MTECTFCDRMAGNDQRMSVLETEYTVATIMRHQRSLGSVLVVPRRHSWRLDEMTVEETVDFDMVLTRIVGAIDQAFDPDGLNIWQGGRLPDPKYAHVHAHVCPRYDGQEYSYIASEDLPVTPDEELRRRVDAIQKHL
jgi:diadenosine tetraphosphate (Ap4A) HIT family hydrolase